MTFAILLVEDDDDEEMGFNGVFAIFFSFFSGKVIFNRFESEWLFPEWISSLRVLFEEFDLSV